MSTTTTAATTDELRAAVREQIDRVFDAQATVMLSDRRLSAFSGDEDSVDIVMELSTVSHCLGAAKELLGGIASALEVAVRNDEKTAENKEPAPGRTKPPAEVVESIERQRTHIFEAMGVIDVTALSCDEGVDSDNTSREHALRLAYKVLDGVAGKLDEINLYGSDRDDDEGGAA
jgi:hypothetical protein